MKAGLQRSMCRDLMGIIKTWGEISEKMEESTACSWWRFMDLFWSTLTSWTAFLSPQHLLCPSPGCPFIIKSSRFSPQFHTWGHSGNQSHQSLEHWRHYLEDWRDFQNSELQNEQSLSFVQVPAIPAIPDTHLEQLCPEFPWAPVESLALRKIKPSLKHLPVWERRICGAVEGSQPRRCYPLPTSPFEAVFPKCQGGWQSWRIRGRGGVSCQKKRENRNYEDEFMMARSRRKVGIRRCQGSTAENSPPAASLQAGKIWGISHYNTWFWIASWVNCGFPSPLLYW